MDGRVNNLGFGFSATGISGFPTGAASLTGRGSYNPGTGLAVSAGRVSGRRGRSLGHGRAAAGHDLQLHRISSGAREDGDLR
jgi:hypothetical protein